MFGILFIYFIGKYFYDLAVEFKHNKWLFTVLAVVVYYVGSAIGGLTIGIIALLFDIEINWEEQGIGLIAVPFGIGAAFLFYYLLKKKWQKEFVIASDEIQDIGMPQE